MNLHRLTIPIVAMLLLASPHVPHALRANTGECVVLLHGLGRTTLSMLPLEWALTARGYRVVNQGYPSTEAPIERLAEAVGSGTTRCRQQGATTIHYVTHSLGGILVRQYFQRNRVIEAKRMVMLGPPNHGSEIVDNYGDRWWFELATGPAGQQLRTAGNGLPGQLKPVPLEIGVIAGTASSDPWFSPLIPGADDGKVSIASTRLAEMRDFAAIDAGHTLLPIAPAASRAVAEFLADGRFRNAATEARQ